MLITYAYISHVKASNVVHICTYTWIDPGISGIFIWMANEAREPKKSSKNKFLSRKKILSAYYSSDGDDFVKIFIAQCSYQ